MLVLQGARQAQVAFTGFAAKSLVIDSVSTGSDSDRIKVRPQGETRSFVISKKLLDPVVTAPGTDTLLLQQSRVHSILC